jgi:hypothetical protein
VDSASGEGSAEVDVFTVARAGSRIAIHTGGGDGGLLKLTRPVVCKIAHLGAQSSARATAATHSRCACRKQMVRSRKLTYHTFAARLLARLAALHGAEIVRRGNPRKPPRLARQARSQVTASVP